MRTAWNVLSCAFLFLRSAGFHVFLVGVGESVPHVGGRRCGPLMMLATRWMYERFVKDTVGRIKEKEVEFADLNVFLGPHLSAFLL